MQIDISAAETLQKRGGVWLSFKVPSISQAGKIEDMMADGKPYVAEIKRKRQKRSLNANAYMWILCEKIAENQGLTKEDVYRHHIREVGVCKQAVVDNAAVDTLIHAWKLNGIGWVAEKLDDAEEGFSLICLYYGSSTYNSKQMARLIDNVIQDCKALGIETMTPSELALLKDRWKPEL